MSFCLSERETANWIKGSKGLTVTKNGLSQSITKTWKNHLKSWDTEEQDYLPQFFINVEEGNIKYRRKKGWKIECKCQSCKCKEILDRLIKLHVNPKSMKIVWNPFKSPDRNQVLFKLIQHKANSRGPNTDYFSEVCPDCGKRDCLFGRHRKDVTLFEDQENENVDKYYWKIANMFMFRGNERNSIVNTGPEDTDGALIFKMMKNCTLFTLGKGDDGRGKKDSDDSNDDNSDEDDENEDDVAENEIYQELLDVRNFVMHTPDNRLSDECLEECFKQMKTILRAKRYQDDCSEKAVEDLSELQSMTFVMTSLSSEEASIVREAFAEQKSAIEYDMNFTGKLKSDRVLEGILKVCVKNSEDYTGLVKQKDDNRGNNEGRQMSNSKKKDDNRGHTKGSQKSNSKKGSGVATASGAATGATVGLVAGPVGAALGAAVGGLIGKLIDDNK